MQYKVLKTISVSCVFQTCQKLAVKLLNEHKQTRIPGEPRDFMDCYLDEMDKVGACTHLSVWVVCLCFVSLLCVFELVSSASAVWSGIWSVGHLVSVSLFNFCVVKCITV